MGSPQKEASINMTSGKSLPLILRFSAPILLGSLFQQMYTVVDGIVVGKNVGTQALAAVGVGFPITYMITSMLLGLGLGTSVLVSQRFGRGDLNGIKEAVTTINSFLLLISVPITLLGILTAGPFLRLLNTDSALFDDALLYMVIYYLGLLPQIGYNVYAGVFQGIGDSKTPLYILIISSILHIILAVLLVAVFPLGVAGVALSTVISQLFSWVLSIILLNKRYPDISVSLRKFKIHRDSFVGIMRAGVPIGLQNALFSVGMMVMQPLINGLGDVFIAGYNSAVKVDGFVFMPVSSLAAAITTFVGQNLGANRLDRVKEGVRASMILALALCAIMCAVVIPFRMELMYLFTNERAVAEAGNEYLLRVIPLYVISTVQYMLIGVIRGSGRTLIPTVSTLVSLWLARVPAAYLLTEYFGPNNMHWCYAIGWTAGLLILVPYYFMGKWKKALQA